MNAWNPRANELFLRAIELQTPDERRAYLAAACDGDTHLRSQAEALLEAIEQAGSFLEVPAASPAVTCDALPLTERPGTVIGPYKLMEQIGEGGMGVVYVAEQSHPVRRKVALKVIKPGMDTKQVVARFEAERQALAMMDHPNIAKVHDGGTTESGRPYFVMELVPGVPITEYCDGERLSVRQRLELFVLVCRAVQHAHQKGIIHRDLKPSNILVTLHDGVPVPKVIDFGVAKAAGQSLTEKTVYTALSQLVGTPLYMSPEQAEMNQLGVDTRSDVYSLGVLLYELLTGTTPFDKETLSGSGLDEMRRMIREVEPPRPSARLSTLQSEALSTSSHRRGTDPRQMSAALRGELDWIVMKSLEKDRGRRYESASAFATDVQRYLDDEPVLACPPSTMYKFHKFARKHRAALATAVAIAGSLILGTTASAWQAVRATTAEAQANANATQAREKAQEATAQRDEAQKQRDEVRALNDRLQRTLYAAHMNVAQHTWEEGNIQQVQELLEEHRPKAGESDLRGFEWYYLDRLCHAEILTIKGGAASVVFSPDGKRLAGCGAFDGTVKVWDAQTGQELHSLKGGGHRVAFSPDGKRVATGGGIFDVTKRTYAGVRVKVWDAQTGQELLSLPGLTDMVWSVAFSPDGNRVATGDDKTARIWDAQTGQELLTCKGQASYVDSVAFSPDGKRLAGRMDYTVKVWDAQTGRELLTLKDTFGGVTFSPDGKRLASSGGGRTVKVWDAQTGQELLSCKGHNGQINSVAFSSDGKRLASAGWDRMVHVWDAQTGQELLTYKGHSGMIMRVAFSPDGAWLASAAMDGTVRVWDATTSPEARTFGGPTSGVFGVVFSSDGKRLAGATEKLADGSWDNTVRVWDAQTGRELLNLKAGGISNDHFSPAFSPDGKRLAGATREKLADGSWDNTVRVWDAQTGQELRILKGHTDQVLRVAFNADGKRLASASSDNTVKVWDAQTGQELFSFKTGPGGGVAFSPDGKRLATASGRGQRGRPGGDAALGGVKVWDTQTGQELLTLKTNAGPGRTLTFSPDGKRLASSQNVGPGVPGQIKVWDSQTGQELLTLKGHMAGIQSVVFSPDGKRLASSARFTNTVKVWDAQSGQELLNLKAGGEIRSLAFSPDGHWLVGDPDGTVMIWDATPLPAKP